MPDQYSQLLEWRRGEGTAPGQLARLPPNFYASVAGYLAELKRTYEAELRDNPSSRKGELARNTYQRASAIARDIVDSRTDKIARLALRASTGGPHDLPNSLPEERELFARLLAAVGAHRQGCAPYLDLGFGATDGPTDPPRSEAAAREPGAGTPRTAPLVWIRIVKEGRPIAVGSETVEIRPGDVLSVAPEIAAALVQAAVAERIGPPIPPAVT